MNLLQRIGRLEKIAERNATDKDAFIITHAEFLTLTLAEIALRHPEVDNVDGVGAPAADVEGAARINGIRNHQRRISAQWDASPRTHTTWAEHVDEVAAAMKPRILLMKEAFESGDQTAYHRQRAKDRKALLVRAREIVERVEAKIGAEPQAAG